MFKFLKTKKSIVKQLNERNQLPVGMKEFDLFVDRIISGLPELLQQAESKESQAFALATMLLHLGPQESHKEDAFFIHSLIKAAVNQIAHAQMTQIKAEVTARFQKQQEQSVVTTSEVTTDDQSVRN